MLTTTDLTWWYVLKTCSRCLEDIFGIRVEDVLKPSWWCVLKTCSRCLEDIFGIRVEDVLKTSWRRLGKISWRCLEDIFARCFQDVLTRCLEDVFFLFCFVFLSEIFFDDHSRITGLQGKREGIFWTPHYHFAPLHKHLDTSWTITAESSSLHIPSSWTWTGNIWNLGNVLKTS